MQIRHAVRTASLLVLAAGATAAAGPLNPPPGAVSPTDKTLTEVEPRIAISATNTPGDDFLLQGGSHLADSLTRSNTGAGIRITADSNRVDRNHLDSNGERGLDAGATMRNIVTNNSFCGHGAGGHYTFTSPANYFADINSPHANIIY